MDKEKNFETRQPEPEPSHSDPSPEPTYTEADNEAFYKFGHHRVERPLGQGIIEDSHGSLKAVNSAGRVTILRLSKWD